MRNLFLSLIILAFALPSWGSEDTIGGVADLGSSTWHFVDSGCTDSFNVPATTDGTDLTDPTAWDSMAEAINPAANVDDAVQTSGVADGWCDDTPWQWTGIVTIAGDEELYIGPVSFPTPGLFWFIDVDTIVTDYNIKLNVNAPWSATLARPIAQSGAVTALAIQSGYFGPTPEGTTQLVGADQSALPAGVNYYIVFDIDGAGAWDLGNFATAPARSLDTK